MQFVISMYQIYLLILFGGFLGLGISIFLKVPIVRLKYLIMKIMGKKPMVYGLITEDGRFELRVTPRAKFILVYDLKKETYISKGDVINLFGFSNSRVYYEESNLALNISPQSLHKRLLKNSEDRDIDYTYMSSDNLSDLCFNAYEMAIQIGRAKMQKKQAVMLYGIAGIGIVTLGLVAMNYIEGSQAAKTLSQIAHYLSSQVSHTVQTGGSNYGIKK